MLTIQSKSNPLGSNMNYDWEGLGFLATPPGRLGWSKMPAWPPAADCQATRCRILALFCFSPSDPDCKAARCHILTDCHAALFRFCHILDAATFWPY